MTQSSVSVYVYDLSQGMARQMSLALLGRQLEGIWHTSVVVFGREFYFGGGICCDSPLNTPYGRPVQQHDMGETAYSYDDLLSFLSSISHRFTMATYHLLDNNCNNFSDEVCRFLVGKHIPAYITGLPQEAMSTPFGAMLRPFIDHMQAGIRDMAGQHQLDLSHARPLLNLPNTNTNAPTPPLTTPATKTHPHQHTATTKTTAIAGGATDINLYPHLFKLISTPTLLRQADIAKVIVKMREFVPGAKSDTLSDLTDALNRVGPECAYPMLDLFRLRALRHDECEKVAMLVPGLLKKYVLDGSVRSAQQMALRCATNCFAHPLGALSLLGSQHVIAESVAVGLAADHQNVKQAAAALALNLSGSPHRHPTHPALTEDTWVSLISCLGEALHTATDQTRMWVVGALGALCVGNEMARDLARAMEVGVAMAGGEGGDVVREVKAMLA